MTIIHTADWHIGKILHKQDLYEDISIFLDWLFEYLKNESIDLLLVSGDVFDLANPSNRDTRLYYQFISKLTTIKTKAIITGGNHDSIGLLDAPSNLLNTLGVDVIGGARADIAEEIIPFYNENNVLECVILAVPFLRDKDLRQSNIATEIDDKNEVVNKAIQAHYDNLVEMATEKYGKEVVLVAMGHFYMQGSITSDSEREIHIGSLQGIDFKIIHQDIDYMAMGHIHKPQRVNHLDHIRYSGSPIFLDFSERAYDKQVIQLNIENNEISDIKVIPIPKTREIIKFSGTFADVKRQLDSYQNIYPSPSFVELEVIEAERNPLIIQEIERIKFESEHSTQYRILKSRTSFPKIDQDEDPEHNHLLTIEDLTPLQIFERRLNGENIEENLATELKIIYLDVVQSLNDPNL